MKNFWKLISVSIFLICFAKNSASSKSQWWKYTTIYEIFTPSFKDSNGDGIGDLKGVALMLDHFVDLGIETIWLTPFYKSPMVDGGYDVSHYTDIDPIFGTFDDFDELVGEMKKRGLKLILDFVINHSSDQHSWFQKSIEKIPPYTDYYIWKDPKGFDSMGNPVTPNNWLSAFSASAWQWHEKRKQFYFHQFTVNQPDLNLRNPQVQNEIKNILKFWFDKGVNGARLDASKYYMEDELFRDEPVFETNKNKIELDYSDLDHIYTTDLPETYEFVHQLRKFSDQLTFDDDNGETSRILLVEAYCDMQHTMMYYGNKTYPVVHFPFNFEFSRLVNVKNATEYDGIIKNWLNNMPPGAVANWVAENHDRARVAQRFNEQFADIIVITIMTLPGIANVYYGQEIGMTEDILRQDQLRGVILTDWRDGTRPHRDHQRLPMQWDSSLNAGFSSNRKPWLPVSSNYWNINVQKQKKLPVSRYKMFKYLSQLRKTKTAKYGDFKSFIISPWVYAFTRSYEADPTHITILNLGSETEIVNFHNVILDLPPTLKVVTGSINCGYIKGQEIDTGSQFSKSLIMRPMSAMVLTT